MNTVPFPLLTPMHDTVELNFLNIITDGDVAGRDYTVQKRCRYATLARGERGASYRFVGAEKGIEIKRPFD